MRVLKDTPFAFGFLVYALRPPQRSLVVVVKGTFIRGDDGAWAPAPEDDQVGCSGEAHWDDDDAQSLRYDTDFALHKPRGEVHLAGTFHAPQGQTVTSGVASFRFGAMQRAFAVFGERSWSTLGGLSEPAPFASLPLRWEYAYGGPGHATNPVGVGADRRAPPRIEDPADLVSEPRSRPEPAGAAPLARSWPPRARLTGTYDRGWLKHRWPWLPEDFDYTYFNSAPEAQRVSGYFRGDEDFAWRALDPEWRLVEGRLPGLRARAFLQMEPREGGEFREVPLVLDTVVLDADHRRVLCTWRGVAAVESEALTEVAHLFYVHEPLDAQTPLDTCRAWYERRLAEEEADDDVEAAEEAEPALAEALAPYDAMLRSLGIIPENFLASLEAPPEPITVKQNRENLAKLRAAIEADGEEVPPELAAAEQDVEAVAAEEPGDGLAKRAHVIDKLTRDERDFTEEDLTGADLSELDLRGVIFRESTLRLAVLDRAHLDGADLTGADLGEVRARGARFVQARLDGVEAAGLDAPFADFSGASLEDAELGGASLDDTRWHEAHCKGTVFAESSLARAVFTRAVLDGADLDRATLTECDFTEASLDETSLEAARCAGSVFDRARLSNVRAGARADFTGCRARNVFAREARLQDSVLDQSDFSFSNLEGADFSGCSMVQTQLNQCVLRKANFRAAVLVGAVILKSDAMEACFEAARLSHADLRGTSLFAAAFWEAVTDEVQWELADLRRTLLDPEAPR
ncbi:MAG: DUF2169 domain-containing protein [Polyangiales bacterium]